MEAVNAVDEDEREDAPAELHSPRLDQADMATAQRLEQYLRNSGKPEDTEDISATLGQETFEESQMDLDSIALNEAGIDVTGPGAAGNGIFVKDLEVQ